MSWRDEIARRAGPGFLMGITFGDWLSLLRENKFAIAPSCLPRAACITIVSISNSLASCLEMVKFQRSWEKIKIAPPLFILGHYRSGTTHLHNLLALDHRFGYLNSYQSCHPASFLLMERFGRRLFAFFLPRHRPFDNVRFSADAPYEDEIALANSTGLSSYMTLAFPKRHDFYDPFLTFRNATSDEIQRWRHGLTRLLQKLALKTNKPVVLKSPPHTGRIKLLLEMFPDAKFVHIHRDPYAVIQSSLNLMRVALDWQRLQDPRCLDWEERTLAQWREMYDAYFAERALIPAHQFHELAFADLERDPIGALRRLYENLALAPFEEIEPRVAEYLSTISSYEKNKFAELSPTLRTRIMERCRRGFDEWGYDV